MNEEFDTINKSPTSLNGWFDGFCPSNGIADRLNNQAKGVWAQKSEWDKKMISLKNGKQAAEWESLKKEVKRLEEEIKNEQIKLNQEKGISDALGLGAWCNGAVSKRKKAEESLRNAEKSLGQVKGAFLTLENQQRQGIKTANEVIASNRTKLEAIKGQIVVLREKIAKYKAERDNKVIATHNNNPISEQNAKTKSIVGKLKENAFPIAGGLAFIGALIYVKTSKPKRKSKVVQV
ncbi:hypothetical protein [uncultured Tenacibaculum sp.]|uniref:hypothetical protein n=1 Tax=uncultured Tenacibaculum sp. TaxID=174713 RepID=UPI00261CDF9B|nr:hypothetical protein [uncultured Tenacibaculum sp.]